MQNLRLPLQDVPARAIAIVAKARPLLHLRSPFSLVGRNLRITCQVVYSKPADQQRSALPCMLEQRATDVTDGANVLTKERGQEFSVPFLLLWRYNGAVCQARESPIPLARPE